MSLWPAASALRVLRRDDRVLRRDDAKQRHGDLGRGAQRIETVLEQQANR